ncbi:uncharacterized protein LOC129300368 [Prosopis cineraria]|uniref:uncharacterized protein LOC129300368 n=1 Tax=Prosopis cineraria TaxID=364024 RepID=UPI0024104759|nr:uncharacterized protein LOC129300368 [Prosopis cineraria]
MSVRYAKTAREIWLDLGERFGKGSAPRAFELCRAIVLSRQENKQSVPTYYTKLKSLWDELMTIMPWPRCSCGNCKCGIEKQIMEMKEREQLYEFLMGLDDSFNIVKTQILSIKPLPRLGQAYHLVVEDEQQRQISAITKPSPEAVAFLTQAMQNGKDGMDRRESKKERPKCAHCQKLGHTEDRCYDLMGYLPDW